MKTNIIRLCKYHVRYEDIHRTYSYSPDRKLVMGLEETDGRDTYWTIDKLVTKAMENHPVFKTLFEELAGKDFLESHIFVHYVEAEDGGVDFVFNYGEIHTAEGVYVFGRHRLFHKEYYYADEYDKVYSDPGTKWEFRPNRKEGSPVEKEEGLDLSRL